MAAITNTERQPTKADRVMLTEEAGRASEFAVEEWPIVIV